MEGEQTWQRNGEEEEWGEMAVERKEGEEEEENEKRK